MHQDQYQRYRQFQPSSIQKSRSSENLPTITSLNLNSAGNSIKSPRDRQQGNNKQKYAKLSARLSKQKNVLQFHDPNKYRSQKLHSNVNEHQQQYTDLGQGYSGSKGQYSEWETQDPSNKWGINHNHSKNNKKQEGNINFNRDEVKAKRSFKRKLVFDQKQMEQSGINQINVWDTTRIKSKQKNDDQKIRTARFPYQMSNGLQGNLNYQSYPDTLQYSQIEVQGQSIQKSIKNNPFQMKRWKSTEHLNIFPQSFYQGHNLGYGYSSKVKQSMLLPKNLQQTRERQKFDRQSVVKSIPNQSNQAESGISCETISNNDSSSVSDAKYDYCQNQMRKASIQNKNLRQFQTQKASYHYQDSQIIKFRNKVMLYKKQNKNLKDQNEFLLSEVKRYKKTQQSLFQDIDALNNDIYELKHKIQQLEVQQKYKSQRTSYIQNRSNQEAATSQNERFFGTEKINNFFNSTKGSMMGTTNGFNKAKDRIEVKLKRSTSTGKFLKQNLEQTNAKQNLNKKLFIDSQENISNMANGNQITTSKFANAKSFNLFSDKESQNNRTQHIRVISNLSNNSENFVSGQSFGINPQLRPSDLNKQQLARVHQQFNVQFCQLMQECSKERNPQKRQHLRKELSELVSQMEQIRNYLKN